jgi:hypothetical protein
LTAKVLLFRRNAKQPQALRKKKNPPQLQHDYQQKPANWKKIRIQLEKNYFLTGNLK